MRGRRSGRNVEESLESQLESSGCFDQQKARMLSSSEVDQSKKGSIDSGIVEFISFLNDHEDFLTLSSCSGRIILVGGSDGGQPRSKKGCTWIYVAHDDDLENIRSTEIWEKLTSIPRIEASFKYESFILHVQCRNLEVARQILHIASAESGFRNSGLTIGKSGKIVCAIRSSHGLEIPLSDDRGNILITQNYLDFLIQIAKSKMIENRKKYLKLFANIKSHQFNSNRENNENRKVTPVKNDQVDRGLFISDEERDLKRELKANNDNNITNTLNDLSNSMNLLLEEA